MARKTKQNKITSPELLEKINPKNLRLMTDYIIYLKSIQRAETTISSYSNDLQIFFVWNLLNNNDKFFTEITKRDLISYQNWLLTENKNSPARIRRLKSTLSSLSNYIENILDDEIEFKSIIKKVESPINQPVREKTILEDDQIEYLLNNLIENKQYHRACALALAANSGVRKSELARFKVDYFKDENIIYGSLYKTPEKIKTKGRSNGKYLYKYILSNKFKPYFDLWMEQRKELGIESEWLLVDMYDDGNYGQIKTSTLNSWATIFSRILNVDFYFHSLRHYFTTSMSKLSIPHSVIKDIVGWESVDMCLLYDDTSSDENIGKYFDENGIKQVEQKDLKDL